MIKIKDDRPLVDKLRQLAKWYNLSNPYAHNVLLEAADKLDEQERELDSLYRDIAGIGYIK
jgi:hypothetical protein